MRVNRFMFFLSFLILIFFLQAETIEDTRILEEIFATASPTGYEEKIILKIQERLPQGVTTERDGMGSLYAMCGEGKEQTAVVTGIDEVGYIVSGFDERGYLNLDRAVPAPHGLFDSFQFGHPLVIWTQSGQVKGVLTLPSLHIIPRDLRNDLQNLFTIENALVDIGANSEAEAKGRGIAMLDPVTPLARITTLAGRKMSGPSLGTKVCASVLLQVAGKLLSERDIHPSTLVWLAQSKFPARRSRPRAALGALVAKGKLAASRYLIIDTYPVDPQSDNGVSIGNGPVFVTAGGGKSDIGDRILQLAASESLPLQRVENSDSMILNAFLSEQHTAGLFIPLKFPATPNEIVDFRDVETLMKLISFLLQRGG